MSDQGEPLESGLVADIPKSRALYERLLKYHWEYYSELAFQRAQVREHLRASLAEHATPFTFSRWQRAVKYKYSLSPLSAKGSLADPGGRFNIGEIDTTRFAVFAGLYLTSDKGTALAELLGRPDVLGQPLTAEELALTRPTSITVVSVSGDLESVLNVCKEENLAGFVNLIKGFRLAPALIMEAKALGVPLLHLVTTPRQLVDELRSPTWRAWPMHYDLPSPSQIFGQIVMDAGIEGILYTSILTDKPCIVVYPQNFANSSSFIEIDDPVPADTVQKRIDASSLKNFV